ncbi:MAG: YdcF family protein, partial [Planctomycetaceae bacterium]
MFNFQASGFSLHTGLTHNDAGFVSGIATGALRFKDWQTPAASAVPLTKNVSDRILSRVEIAIKNSLLPKDVFRHDDAARADIGIVMGSPDAEHLRQRIATGITLFKAGKVPKLIVCGDGREKDSQQKSEAVRMKEFAVKSGIAETSIIIEDTGHDPIE